MSDRDGGAALRAKPSIPLRPERLRGKLKNGQKAQNPEDRVNTGEGLALEDCPDPRGPSTEISNQIRHVRSCWAQLVPLFIKC